MNKELSWVAVADIHLNNNDPYGKESGGSINSRVDDRLGLLGLAVDHAVRNHPDLFVILGDTYNSARPVDRVRKAFYEALQPLTSADIPVYIILGNHDMAAFDSAFNLDAVLLANHPNIRIIESLTSLQIGGFDICMIPWKRDDDSFVALDAYQQADVVFGHLEVRGCEMSGRKVCEDGIDPALLSDKIIRLGHFHKRQDLYVGALARQNFGEADYVVGYESGIARDSGFDGTVVATIQQHAVPDRSFAIERYRQDDLMPRPFDPEAIVRVIISGTKAQLRKISLSNEIVVLRRHYEGAFYSDIVFEAVDGQDAASEMFSADDIMSAVFGDRVERAKVFLSGVEDA